MSRLIANTPEVLRSTIVYRKLQPDDVGQYRALRLECLKLFPELFGSTYEEEAAKPRLKFETLIAEGSDDDLMLGAFCENQLIGIAGFIRSQRRKIRHRGEVVQVYVNPEYRGKKIGENLMRKLLEKIFTIVGIEQVELGVVCGNTSAITLYEKLGFEKYGVQKNYFKDGERYYDQQFMQLFKERYLNHRLP